MSNRPITVLSPLLLVTALATSLNTSNALAANKAGVAVDDGVIAQQRAKLAKNTANRGFGPQSPRDIDQPSGDNNIHFSAAPAAQEMHLCNIHFHANAEHKGGEFTRYAGNGDGKGHHSGYLYSGKLSKKQLKPYKGRVCGDDNHTLKPGDTLEVHFVHSTAPIEPGPTLESCLTEGIQNPQLRVETQVIVLANDRKASDFGKMTEVREVDGYYQAPNIPTDTGKAVEYEGSTTGPAYNTHASPFQVTWNVRPKVKVVDIKTVAQWCNSNEFDEYHAHGVRNLVTNPSLLSAIESE